MVNLHLLEQPLFTTALRLTQHHWDETSNEGQQHIEPTIWDALLGSQHRIRVLVSYYASMALRVIQSVCCGIIMELCVVVRVSSLNSHAHRHTPSCQGTHQ